MKGCSAGLLSTSCTVCVSIVMHVVNNSSNNNDNYYNVYCY